MRKRSVRLERRRYTALPRAEKQPEKQPERSEVRARTRWWRSAITLFPGVRFWRLCWSPQRLTMLSVPEVQVEEQSSRSSQWKGSSYPD